jgi:hypothetical protein
MDAAPPISNRLFTNTPDDRRGAILVTAVIGLVYVLLLLLLRIVARRRNFGGDDWIAVASTVRKLVPIPALY